MSKKLKIGFVLDDTLDTPDGVQQYVLTIGEWMRLQGHDVHYLVGESYRTDIQNVHSLAKNIRVTFNKNRLSIPLPTNKKVIAKTLNKLQLDVLHVQMPYSPLFAGRVISAAPNTVKIVGTFHIVPATWLEKTGAKSLQLITKHTLKRFNSIISVSSAAQTFAKTVFGLDTIVIPNTVNLQDFKHKPIYKSPLHIVFLGRLVERKGCEYFLKALSHLQTTYSTVAPFNVTIAGKGPLLKRLQQYTLEHNLPMVTFAGFIDEKDKPALLASADIAVFPSTGGESFGIVLIEAMAAGSRVVLGGNNVGYKSVLGNNPSLLISPRDTAQFAQTLHKYIHSKKDREMAYKWNKKKKDTYDVGVVGTSILHIYGIK